MPSDCCKPKCFQTATGNCLGTTWRVHVDRAIKVAACGRESTSFMYGSMNVLRCVGWWHIHTYLSVRACIVYDTRINKRVQCARTIRLMSPRERKNENVNT